MIGKRIEIARESKGITQAELAKKTGITQQAIQRIEGGQTRMPRSLDKIATVLGVKQEWLLTGNPLYANNSQLGSHDDGSKIAIENTVNFSAETMLLLKIWDNLIPEHRATIIALGKSLIGLTRHPPQQGNN